MAQELPHDGVFVRLGVSPIEGVGVFAIRSIARGTNIFANDKVELVWVDREAIKRAAMTPSQRKLYEAFAIIRGDRLGCPVNFHNLTPGWYLNEPAEGGEANVRVDAEFNFFARRDIEEGEELTVRYDEFSDGR
jgi:hypothetical protein